jgi:hypothetical protein
MAACQAAAAAAASRCLSDKQSDEVQLQRQHAKRLQGSLQSRALSEPAYAAVQTISKSTIVLTVYQAAGNPLSQFGLQQHRQKQASNYKTSSSTAIAAACHLALQLQLLRLRLHLNQLTLHLQQQQQQRLFYTKPQTPRR